MSGVEYILKGVFMIMGYLIAYSLIDRICRCVESYAHAKFSIQIPYNDKEE